MTEANDNKTDGLGTCHDMKFSETVVQSLHKLQMFINALVNNVSSTTTTHKTADVNKTNSFAQVMCDLSVYF